MKKLNKKHIIFISLLFFGFIIVSSSYGKYIYNNIWNYYLKSKEFYFESDLLSINTKKNSLLKWDGNNIFLSVTNALNPELISEYNISYRMTCEVLGDESEYLDCVINDTNSSVLNDNLSSKSYCVNNVDDKDVSGYEKTECEINGYTWKKEIAKKNNYFNLILKDETKSIDEAKVLVTLESISPYHKTLTGIFNINRAITSDANYDFDYQSFSEYDKLSIINKTEADKCFVINFDTSNYLFDITDEDIISYNSDSNNKINQINFKVNKNSSSTYMFYKINNEKQYSINDFDIAEKEC